jgi:hypothetical protein
MKACLAVWLAFAVALLPSIAVAVDEPRLAPAEVRRAADVTARQHADLKVYVRGEPFYNAPSKTWSVNYRLKSSSPSASQGVLSVDIDDTTGFASARFWLTSPAPEPSASRRFDTRAILNIAFLLAMLAMFVWVLAKRFVSVESQKKA